MDKQLFMNMASALMVSLSAVATMLGVQYLKSARANLEDAETRQAWHREHVKTGIPFQIRALRESKGMTQVRLAELSGMDQANISRLENPDYQYVPTIATLQKLADVFDLPLIVRFGTWKELQEWERSLSVETLAPKSKFSKDC